MLAITPYIIHRNPYCLYVSENHHKHCIENQRTLITSFSGKEPIVHTCFAGASEIVYPIYKEDISVGFISVSGYRISENEEKNINRDLWYTHLIPSEIPKRLTDVLIPPLRLMIEKLLCYETDGHEEINLILRYVADRFETADLSNIADHFNRSKSHVSHIFKSKTGKSLRAYLNDLKLGRARELLCYVDDPITEIALECGFDDTSYFIRLFKEKYGVTPYKFKTIYASKR